MTRLYYALPESGYPDLVAFLGSLEPKLRLKLLNQFYLLITQPLPNEPIVKHFTIEKYCELYELRIRGKIMVRIIFALREDGSILFLAPFIKRHKRNTMQALESSLRMLKQIHAKDLGVCEVPISELVRDISTK